MDHVCPIGQAIIYAKSDEHLKTLLDVEHERPTQGTKILGLVCERLDIGEQCLWPKS
jgi:hypothetical protein